MSLLKIISILGEEYDVKDPSLRSLNHLVWEILFKTKPDQIDREEAKLKNDPEAYHFFQRAYNIAYLVSILNQEKLRSCRPGPLGNRYLALLTEDPYLAFKAYLGREKARDLLRYLNKWIPVYQVHSESAN